MDNLQTMNNKKLISFFDTRRHNLKLKQIKSSLFEHPDSIVNILKPPTKGPVIDVGRGIQINHTKGDAINNYKIVEPVYCRGLFDKTFVNDFGFIHGNTEKTEYYEGMIVIARWDLFGYYYLGKITKLLRDHYADVRFDNGHKQINLSYRFIIRVRKTRIQEGDFVMVNIVNDLDQDCWVPGMVESINYDHNMESFRIILYNENIVHKTIHQLIRISRDQYYSIRDFILYMESRRLIKTEDFIPNIDFDGELDVFGKEYRMLRMRYQPILEPSISVYSVITFTSEKFLDMRKQLPVLRRGQRVLAKWPDDGWYYPSEIKDKVGECCYKVENNLKSIKLIYREDLILQAPENQTNFQIGDTVISAHPKFTFAYAPGEIVRLSRDTNKLIIRFYDYSESSIDKTKVYNLDNSKFAYDIQTIVEVECAWIGHSVIAFNTNAKSYEWGKIVGRINNERQILIQWKDGQQTYQNAYFIFTTKNHTFSRNEFSILQSLKTSEREGFERNEEFSTETTSYERVESKKFSTRNSSLLDRDRSTPILDASEFYASNRRSKTAFRK